MRWQGFFVGALSLTLLEVVVSSQAAASRVGGIFTGVSHLIAKVIDPTVPAFSSSAPTGIIGNAGASAVSGGQAAMNQLAPTTRSVDTTSPLPAGVIAV